MGNLYLREGSRFCRECVAQIPFSRTGRQAALAGRADQVKMWRWNSSALSRAQARMILRPGHGTAYRSLSASPGRTRGRWTAGAALLGVAGIGTVWAVKSESESALGARRSVLFWSRAFPMFLRYRLLEEYVRFELTCHLLRYCS
jgi:hypothetical protein